MTFPGCAPSGKNKKRQTPVERQDTIQIEKGDCHGHYDSHLFVSIQPRGETGFLLRPAYALQEKNPVSDVYR